MFSSCFPEPWSGQWSHNRVGQLRECGLALVTPACGRSPRAPRPWQPPSGTHSLATREGFGVAWQPGLGTWGASGEFGTWQGVRRAAGTCPENRPRTGQTAGSRIGWGGRGTASVCRKVLGVPGQRRPGAVGSGSGRPCGWVPAGTAPPCQSALCPPLQCTERGSWETAVMWKGITDHPRPNSGSLGGDWDQKQPIKRITLWQWSCSLNQVTRVVLSFYR